MPVRRLMPKRPRPSVVKRGGWSEYSPPRYERKPRYVLKDRDKNNPKAVFMYLLDSVYGENNGKALHSNASSGLYFWDERSRGKSQSYYHVQLRGNYLVVTRTRYLVNGQGANAFMLSLGVDSAENMTVERLVVLKHPCLDHEGFTRRYREVAADLEWWEDPFKGTLTVERGV